MSYQIKIADSDIVYDCAADETLLEASERAGLSIPYSCRKGACATCEGVLVSGRVELGVDGGLVREGPAEGVKFCRARPCSDIEIAPSRIERSEPALRRTLTARVHRIERPGSDVTVLRLRFAIGERVRFKAGQYLQIAFGEGGERRNFSMASAPHESDGVQLHVRTVPGGRFSEGVLAGVAKGDRFEVELPFGEFYLRESDSPVMLLATGTGFAPVKSMVEDAIRQGLKRPTYLYWGARRHDDLYLRELPEKWAAQHDWFHFIPVLSETPGSELAGACEGLVHEQLLRDHPQMSGCQVYACGNPAMVSAAREALAGAGLSADGFYCDSFVASG